MTPEELAAHEARHQPTRRGAVCRTCEGLWPCPPTRTSSALREAWAEVETLCDDMAHQVRRHGEAIARAEKAEVEVERLSSHVEALHEWSTIEAERDEWRENAVTLRGLLDNHAHNDTAMEQALRDVTAERDEARAEVERVEAGREVERTMLRNAAEEIRRLRAERDFDRQYQIVAEMQREAEAALARVRALCDDAEIAVDQGRAQGHVCGPDCHCDCLAVEDVRAAADTTRPIDGEA